MWNETSEMNIKLTVNSEVNITFAENIEAFLITVIVNSEVNTQN